MEKCDFNPEVHFSLSGETVFVTGAGGQLGSKIVSGLIVSNANVIVTDMKLNHLEKCAVKHGWDNEKVLLNDIFVSNQIEKSNFPKKDNDNDDESSNGKGLLKPIRNVDTVFSYGYLLT